ncbi:hypothetical protein [Haliangium ochraceum]|uniref:Uncharacterized protein n=1 Tax=Haliangium ochraceum (strain DSM 14365 / JCM 11303 / SMP-2) TaxID=502025 RepID=D0LWN3_HALO1|nr:hypothetical protein [Haliangium ochraceum]ACY17683.1 conserved hypothetical protein [Haliangium ochraceum DSM 14365]
MGYSKIVNDRVRAATLVAEAALTNAELVGERLDEVLAAAHPEEQSMSGTVRRLARGLLASIDDMVAADQTHEAEKADDAVLRTELDDANEALYRELSDLRAGLDAAFGPEVAARVGLHSSALRDSSKLLELGRRVRASLPDLAGLTNMRRGMSYDSQSCIEPIDSALSRLERAHAALERERHDLSASQIARSQAVAVHDTRFVLVARTLESLFRLAGFDELADRVRPSARRPGLTELPLAPTAPMPIIATQPTAPVKQRGGGEGA